jgi:hypothetical protein
VRCPEPLTGRWAGCRPEGPCAAAVALGIRRRCVLRFGHVGVVGAGSGAAAMGQIGGKGTDFRVTLDMDQNSNYVTDVYVVDINSVKGARP